MNNENSSGIANVKKSYLVSILMLVPALVVTYTGIILIFKFHQHGVLNLNYLGMTKLQWLDLHIYSSIAATAMLVWHLKLTGKKFYNTVFAKINKSRNMKISRNIFWVFALCTFTGFIPWISSCFLGRTGIGHVLVGLHDKFGLILIVFLVWHIALKWKSIGKVFSKLMNVNAEA